MNTASTHNTRLGIVIPTFNRSSVLRELLLELTAQCVEIYPQPLVVVVDDGSTDDTGRVLTELASQVQIISGNGNWWFTRCADEGARFAINQGCTAIQIINDDSRLASDFVKQTVQHIESEEREFVFAPISVTYEEPHRIMFDGATLRYFGLKRVRHSAPLIPYTYRHKTIKSDVLPGRGLTFSSTLFQMLGGFDRALLQYHSDEDFCLRALEKGIGPSVHTDVVLYAHHTMTAGGSSLKKSTLRQLLGAMAKPQSRVYLPDRIRMIAKHQPILLAPFLLFVQIILIFRANMKG